MTKSPTEGAALAVKTTGMTKHFGGRKALDGVDLAVARGLASGFLGPNGAGKTTIIRLLLGLAWPTSGTMSVLGHAVPDDCGKALARGGNAAKRIAGALERVGVEC